MWPFDVIDDFLDPEELAGVVAKIGALDLSNFPPSEKITRSGKVYPDVRVETELLPEALVRRIHDAHHATLLACLERLAPNKVPLYDYSQIVVQISGPNYRSLPHIDRLQKLLSGVIYLMPDENVGTLIHAANERTVQQEIEWRPNRGLFFSPKLDSTWHSFTGDGKGLRTTLIYNLCTNSTDMKPLTA